MFILLPCASDVSGRRGSLSKGMPHYNTRSYTQMIHNSKKINFFYSPANNLKKMKNYVIMEHKDASVIIRLLIFGKRMH